METNAISRPVVGPRLSKHQARLEAHRDAVRREAAPAPEQAQQDDAGAVVDAQRVLQSADEMTAALTQFRYRPARERKTADMTHSDGFERVLEDDSLPRAQRIVAIARAGGASIAGLLREARALFSDPSDLVMVLRALLRHRDLDEFERARLLTLLEEVETAAEPRRLKAGINCALKARIFGRALGLSAGLLRETYRQFLESAAPEIEIYEDWIATYGHTRRARVLEFVEGALLTDVAAQDPSCSMLEFGNLLGRIGQLRLLRSADDLLVRTVLANPVVREFNDREPEWLLFLLALLTRPEALSVLLMDTVGEKAWIRRHAERSTMLNVLYRCIKALPEELFEDREARNYVLEEFEALAYRAYGRELIEGRRAW
ncbi:type III secretion system gatekeeper subunit SctW [Burkholderia ubonensis]|uniref:type III secretion system gatekeeper subunit SctW n=1 Tax=Burkholderia ubonensis TaxID=101571 RepID=UPI0007561D45|nr:type III secretion system gatekeeper subunit SctW [Burkholderia ubonensis]KVN41163.1 hypothetical protein WJ64_32695 [Burkholderia ubonensis]